MGKFKSKLANFVYYYKWHMLIALFFVVVLSVLIFQMCTQDKYDVKVMYAGPAIVSDTSDAAIQDVLSARGEDYDKNGKVSVLLYDLVIMSEDELYAAYDKGYQPTVLNNGVINENRKTFSFHALADEFFLLMLSPECYDILYTNDRLVSLDTMGIALEGTPLYEARYDDYGLYLHDLDFAKFYTAFSVLPEDTLVCVKKVAKTKKNNSAAEISQKNHIDFFKAMADFKLPPDYVPPQPTAYSSPLYTVEPTRGKEGYGV